MTEEKTWSEHDAYFLEMVNWLGKSCWVQLGKVEDPITGKKSVDLKEAGISLGMLKMLENKTEGNLDDELRNILLNTISKLENIFTELKTQQTESENN